MNTLELKGVVEAIFHLIPKMGNAGCNDSAIHEAFDKIITTYFSNYDKNVLEAVPFEGINWPYISLGSLTSYSFFNLDECMLYMFYWVNRKNYKTAFDVGANIGIDSIIMAHCGYDVYSFEPDPTLYEVFLNNIKINNCTGIHAYNKGLSDKKGHVEFVHVKGNTTASHIKGERNFYGDVEYIEIDTIPFKEVNIQPDLIKINIEGHEKKLVPSIDYHCWEKMDAFIEIHSRECSEVVFNYFKGTKINIFSRKNGWRTVKCIEDMPDNNKEGYIFISSKNKMPWEQQC